MNNYISITKATGTKINSFLIDQIKSLHTLYIPSGDYINFDRKSNGDWELECRGEINIKSFHDAMDSIAEQGDVTMTAEVICIQADQIYCYDAWKKGKRNV